LSTTASSSTAGIGALAGLTGYMTLGLGAKAKPCLITVNKSEALIARESEYIRIKTPLILSRL
jgi:Vam6/Vps39-like protein vacuolar protein sorting-associated protein 39